ncbi:MAG: cytochrome c family protein [Rhodospirillaceae bacterium]|nr:cytochrome c family protein [Rhodospirillaceae bacterium]MYF87402.1 cytochrome c family protein [Rhodospirillaceae bacterium]MYH35424.1 cytochrome c family protein [Rhodospirillaceae bacterium]MYK14603.1 cytochrome c family protein [Rhodospirillaceae bacterium]
MNINSLAASVLVVGISALVISKVGDILVPETYFSHKAEAAHTPGTAAPAKKAAPDPAVAVALAAADAAKGEKLVRSKCKSCHTWNKGGRNSVGPNLWGVVGREKATVDGFSYSSAMKAAGGDWSFEEMYTFLKRPSAKIKGTKMTYRLRKYKQRADVIAFLRTQTDTPLPLPEAGDAAGKAE